MKKFIFILTLFCFVVGQGFTQTTEKIVVDINDLTPEQVQQFKEKERLRTMEEKLETYGKWVGVGGEVGIAVKEGLQSVVEVAGEFSETKVGEFTLFLIGWKVIGKDVVRIVLGIIFAFIVTVLLFRSWKRMYPRRILVNGSRFGWGNKEYKLIEPQTYEGFEFVKILHVLLLIGSYGITYAIMFG